MARTDTSKALPFAGYIRVSDFDAGAGHSPEWQERIIRSSRRRGTASNLRPARTVVEHDSAQAWGKPRPILG